MSKLRVESFTISLDGFGAGPKQTLETPLGIGGESLHGWALATRTFQQVLFGKDEGYTGIAIAPAILGSGERLFDGIDLAVLGYECVEHVGTPNATHVMIRKK